MRGLEAESRCHSRVAAAFPLCGVLAYMTFAIYLFAATIKVGRRQTYRRLAAAPLSATALLDHSALCRCAAGERERGGEGERERERERDTYCRAR